MKRYSRNILINEISQEGQKKLNKAKILVAGVGGLGSSVIIHLASVGIGYLGLVDFDEVEESNLNRQYIHFPEKTGVNKTLSAKNWIERFNPDINVEMYNIKLDSTNSDNIISKYDIVIDCFDSYNSKFILNNSCLKNDKPLIHGGVCEFYGQVITILGKESACLNCIFPKTEEFPKEKKGIISPVVGVIGSIQSMEAIKYILGLNGLLVNTFLSYDGIKQSFRKITLTKNENCSICMKKQKV